MESVTVGGVMARPVRERGKRGPSDGRWYWRVEWKRKTVWTGWASRDEVLLVAARLLADGIPDERPRLDEIKTVRDLLEVWHGTVVAARTDKSEWTGKGTKGSAKRIVAGLGEVRLDRLTRVAFDEWVGRRLRAGDATTTIHLDLKTAQQAWRWGRQVGACPDRELAIPHVRPTPRDKYTPTLAEVRAVLEWLESSCSAQWAAPFIRLQAATGARRSEIAGLRWDQVDLEAGTVTLRGKTGVRTVPVRRDVLGVLAALPRTTPGVWGVAVSSARNIDLYLRRASDMLGVPLWTTHGLRRLAVDTLARSGVDAGTAAAILGHTAHVMLTAYRQVSLDDMRAGMARAGLGVSTGEVIELDRVRC